VLEAIEASSTAPHAEAALGGELPGNFLSDLDIYRR